MTIDLIGLPWAHSRAAHAAFVANAMSDLADDDALASLSPGARLASEAVRLRTYARIKDDGTRETWRETVIRWGAYMRHRMYQQIAGAHDNKSTRRIMLDTFDEKVVEAIRAVFLRDVMPSMRGLWAAGDVLEVNDLAVMNCAFAPADSPAIFAEALFVLMQGTGFGFSVERRFVNKLPQPAVPQVCAVPRHVIADSTDGWRIAADTGVRAWFLGGDVDFDYSRIRPEGTPLKTKGGEASGPEPLRKYLMALREAIRTAGYEQRKLAPVEIHDLLCLAGSIVQVGGVRRSAMISFSDRDDNDMRWAKHYPSAMAAGTSIPEQRYQANNSWVIEPGDVVTWEDFSHEWAILRSSGAGERGIVNTTRALYRGCGVRGNPCMEIWLAWLDANETASLAGDYTAGGGGLCNLGNLVLRPHDNGITALRKADIASFICTMQACLTNYPCVRKGWEALAKRDALLGVGLAGQVDALHISTNAATLTLMNACVERTNQTWAARFGINEAAGLTCGKPDGNSSVFLGCSSGVHAHHALFYVRRFQVSARSPVCALLRAAGVPCIPTREADAAALEAGSLAPEAVGGWTFEVPVRAPEGAFTRKDETAIQMLERIDLLNRSWLSVKGHNQSATVNVREHEWDEVGAWVFEHLDKIGGLSFFPYDDHVYYGAPLEEITEAEYEARLAALPTVDWSRMAEFENGFAEGQQTFACTSGACSIV